MQDVHRNKLTHPVCRIEVPSRRRIRYGVDRKRLVIGLVPDDRLDDRRGFIGRVEFPFVTLCRGRFHEWIDLREHATSVGELARIWINFIHIPAVISLPSWHTREKRTQWVILRAGEGVSVVLPNICVCVDDVFQHLGAGDDREHGFVR